MNLKSSLTLVFLSLSLQLLKCSSSENYLTDIPTLPQQKKVRSENGTEDIQTFLQAEEVRQNEIDDMRGNEFEAIPALVQQKEMLENEIEGVPAQGQQKRVSGFEDCHHWWWKEFCKLPDCSCSGTYIPKGLQRDKVPQMVVLTFQGSVRAEDYVNYHLLLNRSNPNGCPASATFFVEHENTDYFVVESLAAQRHEIGINGISSSLNSTAWWKKADWEQAMRTGAAILGVYANVTVGRIRGMRAPLLQMGGNAQFSVLQSMGLLYDASRLSQVPGLFWPYTYDYRSTQDCINGPCPTDSFDGIWQLPLHEFQNSSGLPCATLDVCDPDNSADAFKILHTKFIEHYLDVNRAPLVLTISSKWLKNEKQMDGTLQFLDYLGGLNDVYLVSAGKVIDWASNPKPVDELYSFQPWQCKDPAPSACGVKEVKSCAYDKNRRPTNETTAYTLTACLSVCPKCYPWINDVSGDHC